MFGGRALSRDEAFCWGLRGLLALPGSSRGFEAQFRPSEHNARSPTAQTREQQAKQHTPITQTQSKQQNASVSRTASKTLKTRLSARARDHTRFITDDSSLTIGPRGRRAPGRVTRSTTTRTATTPIALIMVAVPLVASTPPKFTATTGPISAWIPATSRASKATQQKIWKASPSS